ncbi:splicing factor, proline- and glutamine-rich-like isoform X3 [Ornithodoros turicata]|uniref:splicing factor, proline- and glutamine-rich-like isoform X3 n=1 Tax=Ornithodoros turicata TaxID=34597 RepID=UPI00313A32D5
MGDRMPGMVGNQADRWNESRNMGRENMPPPQKPRWERGRGSSQIDPVLEQLSYLRGPSSGLESRTVEPKKFTGRCRLFVGNLPSNFTEEQFKKLFQDFGETAEVFLNAQKGFGFVKMDTRQNAEAAKAALDFLPLQNKPLRVRFATHGAALKVKNFSQWVTNELLEMAFSVFGEVERAVVIVDDRGRSVGEGIVEFARKQAAQNALKRCSEACFMLTSTPRPVIVEPLEQRDTDDGLPEMNFPPNHKAMLKEREMGPRIAEPGSFEFEFAMRWKKLYDGERLRKESLEQDVMKCRRQLEDQMEFYLYEHEAKMLREKLRMMEEQSSMMAREREMRLQEERRREEERRRHEEAFLKQQQQQEEEMRRRREEEGAATRSGVYHSGVAAPPPPPHMMGGAMGGAMGGYNGSFNDGPQSSAAATYTYPFYSPAVKSA